MKKRLARLIGTARTLESALAGRVEQASRTLTGSGARQPLEVIHAVVDHIEREIQPTGRDHRAFPFNHVRVSIVAASARTKAKFESVCNAPPSLRERIVDRLAHAGCPENALAISVAMVPRARPDWAHPEFSVECTWVAAAEAAPGAAPCLEPTVNQGTATQQAYSFTSVPIAIGRGADVRDARQRLIRVNHVAFLESGDVVNDTVSRQHARIEQDSVPGGFRVFDDGSAQGTSVIRGGRGLPVSQGTKGLRLLSGDEIVLGQARVMVTIGRTVKS